MRSALALAVAWLITVAYAGAQSTGKPTELAPRQFPAFREIGAFYFEGLEETQVWVNLEPAHVEGAPDPIIFNVTVKFPGTRLGREPATVQFRPQVRCIPQVYPTRARLPVFKLTIDSTPMIDLSPDGTTSFFLPSCGGVNNPEVNQTWDTVSTMVPFATLRRMASAKAVIVDAIGFTVRLTPEDFAALNALIKTVEHGVTVKK
ncbi:MAG TPA: hypothetical protein VKH42_20135 [Vicinamibacterales bacterium]|nr:hypothetical protein [Vicinamibacterales bacterium]